MRVHACVCVRVCVHVYLVSCVPEGGKVVDIEHEDSNRSPQDWHHSHESQDNQSFYQHHYNRGWSDPGLGAW